MAAVKFKGPPFLKVEGSLVPHFYNFRSIIAYKQVLLYIFAQVLFTVDVVTFRSCIYKNENCTQGRTGRTQGSEPVPRFAHQLVYDHVRKVCTDLCTQ